MSDELKILISPKLDTSRKAQFVGEIQSLLNSVNGSNLPQIAVSLNKERTQANLTSQLKSIVSGIKIDGIQLDLSKTMANAFTKSGSGINSGIASQLQAQMSTAVSPQFIGKLVRENESYIKSHLRKTYGGAVDSYSLVKNTQATSVDGKLKKVNYEFKDQSGNLYKVNQELGKEIALRSTLVDLTSKQEAKVQKADEASLKASQRAAEKQSEQISKAHGTMRQAQIWAYNNNKFKETPAYNQQYDGILNKMSIGIDQGDVQTLNEANTELREFQNRMTQAGQVGTDFGTKLRSQFEKLGVYFSASAIMLGAVQQIKQMTQNVIALDTAMTELKKVTDETDASYAQFVGRAETRAKNNGSTLVDTVQATANFARLGYSLKDAETVSDAALVYKNVGDGLENIDDASQSVISSMKAFGIEAQNSMSIVDKFNQVGKKMPLTYYIG